MNTKEYHLQNHLPSSIQTQNVKEPAEAIDNQLQAINPSVLLLYSRVDELPSELLDHLAVLCHVDDYDSGYDLAIKRRMIKNSIFVHKHKGTKKAIETHISSLFGETRAEEWFEYDGKPYTFRLAIEGKDAFSEERDISKLLQAVKSVKNVRSQFDGNGQGDITIAFAEDLLFPLGYGVPIENVREVKEESPSHDAEASIGIGFLTHGTGKGVNAATPKGTSTDLFEFFGRSPLFPVHVGATYTPIDIPEMPSSRDGAAVIGIIMWRPGGGILPRLPTAGETDAALPLFHAPITAIAKTETALPRKAQGGGIAANFFTDALLPRHVGAKHVEIDPAKPLEMNWEIAADIGAKTAGTETREILSALPNGEGKQISMGFIAGDILPRHILTRERTETR
mgnify:CR=1 FL=1